MNLGGDAANNFMRPLPLALALSKPVANALRQSLPGWGLLAENNRY